MDSARAWNVPLFSCCLSPHIPLSLLGSARIPTLKEEERVGENLQEGEDEEGKTFYASEILQTEKSYCLSRARASKEYTALLRFNKHTACILHSALYSLVCV